MHGSTTRATGSKADGMPCVPVLARHDRGCGQPSHSGRFAIARLLGGRARPGPRVSKRARGSAKAGRRPRRQAARSVPPAEPIPAR